MTKRKTFTKLIPCINKDIAAVETGLFTLSRQYVYVTLFMLQQPRKHAHIKHI